MNVNNLACINSSHIMSEERSKGISLRTKRKGRPAISTPKQISGPIQPSGDVPRSNGEKPSFDAPPQRPQVGGKVNSIAQLVLLVVMLTTYIDIRSRQTTVFYSIQQPPY